MCRLPVEFAFSIEAEPGNRDGSIAQEQVDIGLGVVLGECVGLGERAKVGS